MSSRLTKKEEIIRIGDEDTEFIRKNKEYFCGGKWGTKQLKELDKILNEKFNNFFAFSKSGTIQSIFEKIDNSDLPSDTKEYAKKRLKSTRSAWLDESYICTFDGVESNPNDFGDWDFEYEGIQFDLKSSVLPRDFGNYRTCSDIINKPEQFIRDMFIESSKYERANPTYHKQSNRFFMVYYSKKDKNYFVEKSSRTNTEFLKLNYTEKRNIFNKIFGDFKKNEHVFKLKDVEYYYEKEKYKYNEVRCVICLIGEKEDGEIKHHIVSVKNS